jgi:CubicO group peptidase (beta-lactamase class C family)
MWKTTKYLLIFVAILLVGFALVIRIPSIDDGRLLGTLPILKSLQQKPIIASTNSIPPLEKWADKDVLKYYEDIPALIQKSNTTSFLVIKDDKIMYEAYANGIKKHDITQIFSVTKPFVTALLGIAIQEGYIKSLEQHVSEFIPEYKKKDYKNLKIRHLLQMQSGLDYDEYGKLLQTLRFYYQKNLKKIIRNPKVKDTPGTVYTYKSIDTQILGECIEYAVGKPFIVYFYEKIWSKIGAEDKAEWSIDSKISKNLKYFGGLNISAYDLAKFGQVILHNGKTSDGEQIIPAHWLNICDDEKKRVGDGEYCNGWWYNMDTPEQNIYFAAGFNGQIMMINESTNTIIIRLGKNKGGVLWYPLMRRLSQLV